MLVFLDFETTGLDELDKICSIAVKSDEEEIFELINDGKKVSTKASCVHNITNEMLKGQPEFKKSSSYKFLVKNNNENNILVVHNSNFIFEFLKKYNFVWKGDFIDTKRVSKHLIKELQSYDLPFLWFDLKLYRDEKKVLRQHNPLDDICMIEHLYHYHLENSSLAKMLELSSKNVLLQTFSFGKYNGSFIEEIAYQDSNYLRWLLSNSSEIDDDLKYSLEFYLKDIGL